LATAALAHIGAEDEFPHLGLPRTWPGQGGLRQRDRPPFERAAADRAGEGTVGVDEQPGAGLPRRRALGRDHRDHGGASMRLDRPKQPRPDLHQTSPPVVARMARMIASGVAGASSRGMTAGLRLAMASVIAENTEIAS